LSTDQQRSDRRHAAGRLAWSVLLAAGLSLAAAGCTASGPPAHKPLDPVRLMPFGLGEQAKKDALRKKVEADSFPAAKDVGL